jgi:hypothetical protein
MSKRFTFRRTIAIASLAIGISACSPDRPSDFELPPPPPTFTLSGTIVEPSDSGPRPAPSIEVQIQPSPLTHGPYPRTTSDPNGNYSFYGLIAGEYSVQFTSMFHEIVTRTIRIDRDTRLDVELERLPMYTLSGIVFEMTEGGPVPVAGVHVENSNLHDGMLTDEKGFYSIRALRGSLFLYVNKAGYFSVSHDLSISGDTRMDIQLVRR